MHAKKPFCHQLLSSARECHNRLSYGRFYHEQKLHLINSRDWSQKVIYSNHLNTGQVCYSNGPNVSGCQMFWFSNGGLKTGQKSLFYGKKYQVLRMVCLITWSDHFIILQKSVQKVMCLDFRCLVFRWLLYSSNSVHGFVIHWVRHSLVS